MPYKKGKKMKFNDYILESQVLYESDKKTEELLMFADMLEKSLPKLKGKEKENAEKIVHGIYGAIDSGNVDKVYKELLTALKKQNKNKDIKESYYMYGLGEGIKDKIKSVGKKIGDKVDKALTPDDEDTDFAAKFSAGASPLSSR